jgi:hypothetical protein
MNGHRIAQDVGIRGIAGLRGKKLWIYRNGSRKRSFSVCGFIRTSVNGDRVPYVSHLVVPDDILQNLRSTKK